MDAFNVDCVRSQVDAFIAELEKIEGSEFPYAHSKACVTETKDLFLAHRDELVKITATSISASAELVCNAAQADVRQNLDLLGFLLRSTNVRNAFEAYGPLLRMARQALGVDTRLVISSEWMFSPFTYVCVPHLPDTVLVGMPATESANPLLLPLSGHEFGHTAWEIYGLSNDFPQKIEDAIMDDIKINWSSLSTYFPTTKKADLATDLLARAFWSPSWQWARRQCEEYFCDYFGLRLFGEGFLHSFSYLLSPYKKGKRSLFYPTLRARAKALYNGAKSLGLNIANDYELRFEDSAFFPSGAIRENAQLELADRVSLVLWPELKSRADSLLLKAPQMHIEDTVTANLKRFALRVPAEHAGGLSNIITAAWRAMLDPKTIGCATMDSSTRSMLAEMVWKSIEIDEIEHRLALP